MAVKISKQVTRDTSLEEWLKDLPDNVALVSLQGADDGSITIDTTRLSAAQLTSLNAVTGVKRETV